jgi:alpha-beta hydrolase superfamily lysophospholipase
VARGRRGYLNYSVLTALSGDVHSAADELAQQIERSCAATGAQQVHVVGHSLGGLVARYYVARSAMWDTCPWRSTRAPCIPLWQR